MTRKTVIYIIAAILCISAVSCKKDSTIQYNNATMGNVTDGTFTSDQGNIFNVVEQTCNGKLDTMKRAFVVCDVLNKTADGAENEYDVRLKTLATVLTKNIIGVGADADESNFVQDPLELEYIWIAGGYINMFVMFPIQINSKTAHLINMAQQPTEKDGTYVLHLCHNAFGETLANGKQFVLGGGYVSFPISSFVQEDEAKVKIRWNRHLSTGTALSQESRKDSCQLVYKKGAYDHVPSALSSKTKAILQ